MTRTWTAAVSCDGTEIGYFRCGSGPSLVISHGSVSSSSQWLPATDHLAGEFTCFVYDRRGRGRSGDSHQYGLSTEVEDIAAMMEIAGGGAHLLGHSYGALCALAYAEHHQMAGKLLAFEPPLAVDGAVAGDALGTYVQLVEAGQLDDALEFALQRFVRAPQASIDLLRQTPLWAEIAVLTPTWSRELAEIDGLGFDIDHYRHITASTHLLAGTAAPSFLYDSCHALVRCIPGAQITELVDRDHFAHVVDPSGFAQAVVEAIT